MQKNYPTLAEAKEEMDALNAAFNQGQSSPKRQMTTTLENEDDLKEAEMAWGRLRAMKPEGSLITAVDYYLANAGSVIKDGLVGEILEQYAQRRRDRGNQSNTVDVSTAILKRFVKDCEISRISQFTLHAAQRFVFDTSVSVRTRRDRRDQLYNWSEFLVNEKFLQRNFVAEVDRPKVTYDGKVSTLTVEQVLALLKVAATEPVGGRRIRGAMLPYFAICALSGVRPDEAKRLGPDWKWFSKENRLITGFRAKTKNKVRAVEIHPELCEILEHCRQQGLAPSQFTEKAFDRIREKAGVYDLWKNDVLRHTYASHHYAWKRDIGWLEKNMGNSADVLKRSYLDQTIVEKDGKRLLDINLAAVTAN
jgi:integrase